MTTEPDALISEALEFADSSCSLTDRGRGVISSLITALRTSQESLAAKEMELATAEINIDRFERAYAGANAELNATIATVERLEKDLAHHGAVDESLKEMEPELTERVENIMERVKQSITHHEQLQKWKHRAAQAEQMAERMNKLLKLAAEYVNGDAEYRKNNHYLKHPSIALSNEIAQALADHETVEKGS